MDDNRFPEHVSEAVVRATAAEVFVLAALAVALQLSWLALFLAVDFGVRAFLAPRWSILTFLSKRIFVPVMGLRGHPISFAPKRFAATIGFALTAVAFLLSMVVQNRVWLIPLLVLLLFSGLESFAGFCAGCRIYGLLMRLKIVPEHHCPECRLR
jgi:hypothetical protein